EKAEHEDEGERHGFRPAQDAGCQQAEQQVRVRDPLSRLPHRHERQVDGDGPERRDKHALEKKRCHCPGSAAASGCGISAPMRSPGPLTVSDGPGRITRTKCRRRKSAAGCTRSRPSGAATTWPTRRSGGNSPPAPELTTRSPGRTASVPSRKSRTGRGPLSPARMARWPEGFTVTGRRLELSVRKRMRAARSP